MPAGSCARSWLAGCVCGSPPSWSSSSTGEPSTVNGFQNSWRASMGGMKAPEDLLRRIRQGNRFLLTSHINPDGDAIGSELGLARLLRGLGKGAVVWNRDPTPTVYRPLPGSDRIHVGEEPPAGFPDVFDAIIVLECPSPDRTGLEQHLGAKPIINIDHHLGNQCYGAVNWVDSAAPAVGEMVFRLAQGLKVRAGAGDRELPLPHPGDRHRRLPLLQRHRRRLRGRGRPGARGGPSRAGLAVALREPAAGGGEAGRRDAPDAPDPRRGAGRHRPPDPRDVRAGRGRPRAIPRG